MMTGPERQSWIWPFSPIEAAVFIASALCLAAIILVVVYAGLGHHCPTVTERVTELEQRVDAIEAERLPAEKE